MNDFYVRLITMTEDDDTSRERAEARFDAVQEMSELQSVGSYLSDFEQAHISSIKYGHNVWVQDCMAHVVYYQEARDFLEACVSGAHLVYYEYRTLDEGLFPY